MNKELLKLISKWLYHNEKMREINKYLFEHTELYERKYMLDFKDDLFRFFAGKITRYTNDTNKIYKMLNDEETRQLNLTRIMEV